MLGLRILSSCGINVTAIKCIWQKTNNNSCAERLFDHLRCQSTTDTALTAVAVWSPPLAACAGVRKINEYRPPSVRLLLLPCRGDQRPVQKIMGDGLELDVGIEQRNLTVLYVSSGASHFSPKLTIRVESQLPGVT